MVIRLREASSFSARERRKEEEREGEGEIRKQRSRSLRCNDGLGWAGVCRRITVCLGSERGSPRPMFQSPKSRFAPTVNMKIEGHNVYNKEQKRSQWRAVCARQNPLGQQKGKQCSVFISVAVLQSRYQLWASSIIRDKWSVCLWCHQSWIPLVCFFCLTENKDNEISEIILW